MSSLSQSNRLTVTRPEKTVEFCTNLGLKSAHEDAVRGLEDAKRAAAADAREVPSVAVRDAAQRIADLEAEMRDHTVTFTLRAWPRKRWAEYEETHPPRKGIANDDALSINVSTLDEVIAPSIVAVKARDGQDVPFEPVTDWVPLADEMTDGQWQEFALAVLQVNRGVKAAPFSAAASRVIQSFERSSN